MTVGILLDMDGTIVDSMYLLKNSFINILKKEGIEIGIETEEVVGNNLAKIMGGKSKGFSEFRLMWRIVKHIESSIFKKIKIVFISGRKLANVANSALFIKGADDAIRSLKKNEKVKIGIVTSRRKKDVLFRLRKINFDDFFDVVVTREDVKRLKPSPEQIYFAAEKLGLSPKSCIVIGDMSTDVEAARKAGSISIGVNSGIFHKQLIKAQPDFVAQSIVDIPSALDEIIDCVNLLEES